MMKEFHRKNAFNVCKLHLVCALHHEYRWDQSKLTERSDANVRLRTAENAEL